MYGELALCVVGEQRIHRGWGLFERVGLVDRDVDDAGVEQAREAGEATRLVGTLAIISSKPSPIA